MPNVWVAMWILILLATPIALSWFVIRPAFGRGGVLIYVAITAVWFLAGWFFAGAGILPMLTPWIGISVAAAAAGFYLLNLYPNIPQELGGIKRP